MAASHKDSPPYIPLFTYEITPIPINVRIMGKQTIDTYKLTSMEEPSDEILSLLMREVAEDAKRKGDEANRQFFENMAAQAKVELQDWNRRYAR